MNALGSDNDEAGTASEEPGTSASAEDERNDEGVKEESDEAEASEEPTDEATEEPVEDEPQFLTFEGTILAVNSSAEIINNDIDQIQIKFDIRTISAET